MIAQITRIERLWPALSYKHTHVRSTTWSRVGTRAYSEQGSSSSEKQQRSKHAEVYSSMLPGMIPIALLGSAVYVALHLIQSRLSHEKFLDEANERIRSLEQEVDRLRHSAVSSPPLPPSRSSSSWWRWSRWVPIIHVDAPCANSALRRPTLTRK